MHLLGTLPRPYNLLPNYEAFQQTDYSLAQTQISTNKQVAIILQAV